MGTFCSSRTELEGGAVTMDKLLRSGGYEDVNGNLLLRVRTMKQTRHSSAFRCTNRQKMIMQSKEGISKKSQVAGAALPSYGSTVGIRSERAIRHLVHSTK